MLKFFIVFISLLMMTLGGLFTAATSKDSGGVKSIREKVGYTALSVEDKARTDKLITKVSNTSFLSLIVGICLFIASLFL